MNTPSAVWRLMRPKQWTKNLLVLAAPIAAGRLFEGEVATATALAFVSFCLLSSSVYCVNDVVDAEADRAHPRKKHRPVAASEVSPAFALGVATTLAIAGVAVAWYADPDLAILAGSYLGVQLLYSLWLKHEPVVDIAIVTIGFLLRAVAGGIGSQIPISQWFLLVAGFGSLFVVAGKRYSELHTLGSDSGTRRSLVRYTDTYLRFVWSIAAAAAVMSYSLWAFEESAGAEFPWHTISIAPFVLALLRYAVDIDAGTAAEPEDIVLADRVLQGIGLLWLIIVSLGILNA